MRLLYFSPVPISSYAQRSHFIVQALLGWGIESVLWVNPYPCRLPRWEDLRRGGSCPKQVARDDPHIEVLDIPALPVEPLPLGAWLNRGLFGRDAWRRIEQFAAAAETPACLPSRLKQDGRGCPAAGSEQRELMIGVGRPCALALAALRRLHPAASFYDAMDNFPEFHRGLSRRAMRRYEDAIAAEVDLVVVSSAFLADKFIGRGLRVERLLNAFEETASGGEWERGRVGEEETLRREQEEAAVTEHETPAPPLPLSPSSRSPILGYLGCVGHWFDWPLVVRVAEAMPAVRIELVGPCAAGPPRRLPANVRLLPACHESEAGRHLARFSAGLIPFRSNPLTAGVDPIKYYDYRAAGLPVLSTRFGEMALRGARDGVYFLDGPGGFAQAIWAALADRCDPAEIARFRRSNNWTSRFCGSEGLRSLLPASGIRRVA